MRAKGVMCNHAKWDKYFDDSVEAACGNTSIASSIEEITEMTSDQYIVASESILHFLCYEKDEEDNIGNKVDAKKLYLP